MLIWPVLLSLALIFRYFLFQDITKKVDHLKQDLSLDRVTWVSINVVLVGILWGAAFLYLIQTAPPEAHYFAMALAATLLGSGILTLGSSFFVYCLFSVPLTTLMLIGFLNHDYHLHNWSAFATVIGTSYLLYSAYIYANKNKDLVSKSIEIQDVQQTLIDSLGKASEFRDEETGCN